MVAEIRYANAGGVHIAYQVLGEGPRDLMVVMDGFIPVDTMDDEPRLARSMARLCSFARLIRFDRRGIGLSDPVAPSEPPTLEQWVRDALSVLDAVDSSEAVILASSDASSVASLLAATYPERVRAMVIVNGYPRLLVDDDYPQGFSSELLEELLGSTDPSPADSTTDWIAQFAPSAAGDENVRRS